jgi:hypothetical protein
MHRYALAPFIKTKCFFFVLERRVAKEDISIPRAIKEAAAAVRSRSSQDKGKPMKTLPSRKNNGKLKS